MQKQFKSVQLVNFSKTNQKKILLIFCVNNRTCITSMLKIATFFVIHETVSMNAMIYKYGKTLQQCTLNSHSQKLQSLAMHITTKYASIWTPVTSNSKEQNHFSQPYSHSASQDNHHHPLNPKLITVFTRSRHWFLF